MQFAEPVLFLKEPAGHAEQFPAAPVYPALQRQLATLLLNAAEKELSLQIMHADMPRTLAYLPAWHATHSEAPLMFLYAPKGQAVHGVSRLKSPVWLPVNPGTQRQSDNVELPGGELVLTRHGKQIVTVVAAMLPEYVPSGQSVHAAGPIVGLYLP